MSNPFRPGSNSLMAVGCMFPPPQPCMLGIVPVLPVPLPQECGCWTQACSYLFTAYSKNLLYNLLTTQEHGGMLAAGAVQLGWGGTLQLPGCAPQYPDIPQPEGLDLGAPRVSQHPIARGAVFGRHIVL